MKLIDFHADTIRDLWRSNSMTLDHNDMHIDIEKLRRADSLVQCFAMFNHLGRGENYDTFLDFSGFYQRLMQRFEKDLTVIRTFADIEKTRAAGRIGVLMSVEDAGVIDGDLTRLDDIYAMGARLLSFTWNYETCFGYPNSEDKAEHARGLKPLGFEALERLEALGILFDVSHLSRGGTLDAAKHAKKPIIASHSDARALCEHPRNLTDEEIRAIAETGGVIGLNLCREFLSDDHKSTLENMRRHVLYLANVGGEDVVAMGTDFDGISGELETPNVGELPRFAEYMLKTGSSEAFVERLFYKNAQRVLAQVL